MSVLKKFSVYAIVTLMMVLSFGMAAHAEANLLGAAFDFNSVGAGPGSGWKEQENGSWKYQKNGAELTNCWEKIDGKWYRFNGDGIMLTGWQTIDGERYYLAVPGDASHPAGSCYSSETTPDGKKVDENGKLIFENTSTDGIVKANPYGEQTCVEIDLTEQRVYVYSGPNLIISSPVVTGSVAGGHATPAGDYHIYSKERNRTLRGTNNNGTKYASFVNFWMPFNGGIGLHDASWRDSYGGQIYQTGGSHGCVNMPFAKAELLYSVAYVGMPVHVHH